MAKPIQNTKRNNAKWRVMDTPRRTYMWFILLHGDIPGAKYKCRSSVVAAQTGLRVAIMHPLHLTAITCSINHYKIMPVMTDMNHSCATQVGIICHAVCNGIDTTNLAVLWAHQPKKLTLLSIENSVKRSHFVSQSLSGRTQKSELVCRPPWVPNCQQLEQT
jgi:hypothetical protein